MSTIWFVGSERYSRPHLPELTELCSVSNGRIDADGGSVGDNVDIDASGGGES